MGMGIIKIEGKQAREFVAAFERESGLRPQSEDPESIRVDCGWCAPGSRLCAGCGAELTWTLDPDGIFEPVPGFRVHVRGAYPGDANTAEDTRTETQREGA